MIRAMRLYDVPAVTRLLEEPLAGSPSALDATLRLSVQTLLGACLPASLGSFHNNHKVFVDVGRLRVRGFLHLVRQPGGHRWEVVHLCHDGAGDAAEECSGLIEFECAWAASEGATKITARVREDDDRLSLFHDAGFRQYAQETVLVLSGPPSRIERGHAIPTRPFLASDPWALHRIYVMTTPQGVQFVENLTSNEHAFPMRSPMLGATLGIRITSEVLLRGSDVVAALALVVDRPRHIAELHLAMAPGLDHDVARLLQLRLHRLRRAGVQDVVATVRHYQLEQLTMLRNLGFEPASTRAVMVKHTAAYVNAPILNRVLDRAPALHVAKRGATALQPAELRHGLSDADVREAAPPRN
jgi:hypothetical protein